MIQKLKQLPEGWQEVELGDICEIIGGQPAPQDENAFSEDGVPFVRMQDLGRYHYTLNLTKTKNRINPDYKKEFTLIKKGSILIPRSGSVSLNHRAILGIDAYVVSHICALIIKDDSKINNKFLYYVLRRFDMRKIMNKTTGLDAINFFDLKKIKLLFPTIFIQKLIVSILEKAETLKQKRQEADRLTKEYLQSVFWEMFGDKKIPKENIGVLCEVISGSTPSTTKEEYWNGDINWVTPAELEDGDNYYYYESQRKITKEGLGASSLFPKNTVMLTTRAPIGKVAIAGKEMCTNQGFKNMICKSELHHIYLYYWLLLNKDYLNSLGMGATFKEISKSIVEKIKIPFPPLPLQQKFASIVEHVEKLKEKQKQSKEKINELFNSLMQKAFNGELVR